MASAVDVARYLIFLASPSEDEDTDSLSHLRLQKLLYYVQGWHLAVCGKPLFNGRIEAWTNGPVVREVYPVFRELSYRAIAPSEGADSPNLSIKDKEFIRAVWDQYKVYSATALRDKTHRETPWLRARGNAAPRERSDAEITHDSLRAFFAPRIDEHLTRSDRRIDPAAWARARADIAVGSVHTTQEIRRGIRGDRAGSEADAHSGNPGA